ncbi:MAG: hypothetical protein ACKOU7_01735, partial [Ferruginibacter sp.]
MHPANRQDVFFNYFAGMIKGFITVFLLSFFLSLHTQAQNETIPFAPYTTKESRTKEYKNLVSNNILKNLSIDLKDSTEENWQEAFDAMELLNYRTGFIDKRIHTAMNSVLPGSNEFQKAILQLVYALYPKDFVPQVVSLIKEADDPKFFAMCCEYLILNNKTEKYKALLLKRMEEMQLTAGAVTEI